MAKKDDLVKAFNTPDQTEICKEILMKGDLQVSEKERQAQQDALFKDIATIVSEKCVNPQSKRPYPVSIIEKAMKECHVAVKANKGAKQQALDTITKLKAQLPIERAQMRIRITVPIANQRKIVSGLKKIDTKTEKEERSDNDVVMVCLVDPGQYRAIDDLVKSETQGKGAMDLIDLMEVQEELQSDITT